MSSNFQKAIDIIREKANNETEKGNAFEKLSKIFFENDDVHKQLYKKVWHYKDWAKQNTKFSQTDIGIDLVAELANGTGLAAIQCKCYESNHSISKEDMDSFISASNNEIFKRLILIDTSNNDLGPNAKKVIDSLNKEYLRIQKSELEESRIQWLTYLKEDKIVLEDKKNLRDHQIKALEAAQNHFKDNDRGKMIMACGTGKTFTSLRITEKLTGKGKFVLYMVPSLALMSQTIREWKNDCSEDFEAFSACSDKKIGKQKPSDDEIIVNLNELSFPATTNSKKLADEIKKADSSKLIVVFSTYQSIDVVSKAQNEHGLRKFDLILCDEAHRTTGATLSGENESHFVRIHNDDHIAGKKRLYMTATPKIYGEKAKQKADQGEAELASMDDSEVYGETFYFFGFNDAVEKDLLTDYKVVILAIDEEKVSATLQKSFEEGSELKLDEATKIIGCYKALAKVGFEQNKIGKKKVNPIKRVLAFTQSINISKIIQSEFKNVVDDYLLNQKDEEKFKVDLDIEIEHVDGTFSADKRNEKINWLKEDTEKNNCRILTNVKCLSEGVDVPTLDAIMFLHPRKSQIDVVQSVGRVMRKAPQKDMGYVIIPITVAPGIAPERALNNSERYRVVWQILNALRSHDERMDSAINRIAIGEEVSDKIQIIGIDSELEEITSVVDDVKPKQNKRKKDDQDSLIGKEKFDKNTDQHQEEWAFEIGDLSKAIRAKIVEKCGTRDYWENWAHDIAKVAQSHIQRLNSILLEKNSKNRKHFDDFLKEIRDDLNPEITEIDAVEMLAQHIITKPVFNTLFQGNEFTDENSVSKAIEKVLSNVYDYNIELQTDSLEKFYNSIKRKSADIITSTGRVTLINQLYERFFKNAFPKTTEKLGIVYTPVEIVDFINHSVEKILNEEFKKSFNDKNVHILDPFTGTGTFVVRLIETDLIHKEKLLYKYSNEIHANEIVLLAYYIAGINIEAAFHEKLKPNSYKSFNGIVLTDTFQLYEQDHDMVADLLPDNSKKRTEQKNLKITAILGNPPYSVGQSSENDDAKNISYFNLDNKIKDKYLKYSKAVSSMNIYNSYIRAIRWASDRINENGVISYVTASGFLESFFADGMRKSLSEEFDKIYIIDLKGNIRKSMLNKLDKSEGENVFGSGSMSGIAILILVKNNKSNKNKQAQIKYFNLGDNLSREEKLKKIKKINNISFLNNNNLMDSIKIDAYNDWFDHRNPDFEKNYKIADRKKEIKSVFKTFSKGVMTSRDPWCINFSKKKLEENMKKMINFYNNELDRYYKKNDNKINFFSKVSKDAKSISWSRKLKKLFSQNKKLSFSSKNIIECHYRPFTKANVYFSRELNDEIYNIPKIFNENLKNNKVILVKSRWNSGQIALMTKNIPMYTPDGGEQCLPLFVDNVSPDLGTETKVPNLFSDQELLKNNSKVISGISNDFFKEVQSFYLNKKISKDEIFYYIYGILHNPDYLSLYKKNLRKNLPFIPLVKQYSDFIKHSEVGLKLSDIHCNYEEVEKYPVEINKKSNDYKVRKISYGKINGKKDLTQIIFNNNIVIKNIPLDAYQYIIYGKSALDWVIERQSIRYDKASEIINDPNDYAKEIMKNEKYSLELIQKVITVSLETQKLIKALPELKI